jgi:peptidoglycan LD-endopeptidase LytH
MRGLIRYVVCAAAIAGAVVPPASSAAAPGYLEPKLLRGKAFPVARTDYYSVINFANDWHAPRLRLVGGRWRQIGVHEGTDLFAEPGTPVQAVTPGTVENIGWLFYSGWRIGIRGSDGRYWFYAHMSRYAPGMTTGTRVRAGEVIGRVGNTGYGIRPGHRNEFTWHLHVGIQEPDGTWVNPYPVLRRLYRAETEAAA